MQLTVLRLLTLLRRGLLAALFLQALVSSAEEQKLQTTISAGIGWLSGESGFENGGASGIFSKLEWPVSGPLFQIRGSCEYPFADPDGWLQGLGVRGRYGASPGAEGTGSDRDWDDAGQPWLYSEADSESDISFWDADVYLILRPFRATSSPQTVQLTLGLGWGEQQADTTDQNLRYAYDYGQTVGRVDGLIGRYDLHMSGPRISAGVSIDLSEKLQLSSQLVWMPWLEAEGDGDWVLREYTFTQTAEGQGLQLQIQMDYALTETLNAFVSIEATSLVADEQGSESGQGTQVPPYENKPIVNEITHSSASLEIGLTKRF